ncbi:hypothetical protein GGF37_005817 [Kickxella alabastrina]|nr:hypothetical protein GGF37_005817 [Kickxella alabastrina]
MRRLSACASLRRAARGSHCIVVVRSPGSLVCVQRSSTGTRWRSALNNQGNDPAWYSAGYPKSCLIAVSVPYRSLAGDAAGVLDFFLAGVSSGWVHGPMAAQLCLDEQKCVLINMDELGDIVAAWLGIRLMYLMLLR